MFIENVLRFVHSFIHLDLSRSPWNLRTWMWFLSPSWNRTLPSTSCCTPETSPATNRWWKGQLSFKQNLVSGLNQQTLSNNDDDDGCCCRYYADIRQTISASDQEMNSALAELSRVGPVTSHSAQMKRTSSPECSVFQNYSGELNYLVALHELYKYINKYYDQVSYSLGSGSSQDRDRPNVCRDVWFS